MKTRIFKIFGVLLFVSILTVGCATDKSHRTYGVQRTFMFEQYSGGVLIKKDTFNGVWYHSRYRLGITYFKGDTLFQIYDDLIVKSVENKGEK